MITGDAASATPALQHASLAATAADWITNRILEGGIGPGEKVTETGLAELMGISRSPVREALRELSRDGLITIEPRRGAFVSELDRGHAAELYTCRLLLEPPCVARSVASMDKPRRDRLDVIFSLMKDAVAQGRPAAYVSALKDYNWTLLDGCANRILFGFAETSWRNSLRYWDLLVRGSQDYPSRSLTRNKAVHSAVVKSDPEQAERVARVVLEKGRDELAKLLAKVPAHSTGG